MSDADPIDEDTGFKQSDLRGRRIPVNKDKRIAELEQQVEALKRLLIIRDGGGCDVDCRMRQDLQRPCSCGHVEVAEYLQATAQQEGGE